jgi:hypothetical protein
MISRIRRRIRALLRSLTLTGAGKGWLLSALCATAAVGTTAAAAPPGTPAASPPAVDSQQPAAAPGGGTPAAGAPPGTPAAAAPDEGFLEFLGSDDVGDAEWWEFLKKAPPSGSDASARPPQDAKK